MKPACSEPDCQRPAHAKGLCQRHYKRLWRNGTTAPRQERRCSVEGCDGKHWGNGYCVRHYWLMKRRGATTTAAQDREAFDAALAHEAVALIDSGADLRAALDAAGKAGDPHALLVLMRVGTILETDAAFAILIAQQRGDTAAVRSGIDRENAGVELRLRGERELGKLILRERQEARARARARVDGPVQNPVQEPR